jgi:hypothetical protein
MLDQPRQLPLAAADREITRAHPAAICCCIVTRRLAFNETQRAWSAAKFAVNIAIQEVVRGISCSRLQRGVTVRPVLLSTGVPAGLVESCQLVLQQAEGKGFPKDPNTLLGF